MPSAGRKNASPTSPSRRLLIVDELGYLPLEPDAAHLFFRLVSRRYEKGAMLITSSRPTTNI
jgi:DNA replication protein DnaC